MESAFKNYRKAFISFVKTYNGSPLEERFVGELKESLKLLHDSWIQATFLDLTMDESIEFFEGMDGLEDYISHNASFSENQGSVWNSYIQAGLEFKSQHSTIFKHHDHDHDHCHHGNCCDHDHDHT